jgi:hypothetical protein
MEEATVDPGLRLTTAMNGSLLTSRWSIFGETLGREMVLGEHIVRVLHLCDALATTVFQLPIFLLLDGERVEVSH